MQQLIDYIAILAFMVVYFISRDIFLATAVLMGGVTLQIIIYWVIKKPIGNELKLTFWASMLLGGLTLALRDETFIKWKPTIVNLLLACVLLGAHWFKGLFLIKKILGKVLHLPDPAWLTLTYGWACAFAFAGGLNLWVAYTYSLDTWVTFKFFGLMLLNVLFMVLTFIYLQAKGLLTEEHLIGTAKEDTAKGVSADNLTSEREQ